MNRITLLLFILFGYTVGGYGQCINTNMYPSDPFASDNSGYVRTINTCVWTENDYSLVTGLNAGWSYEFSCDSGETGIAKYITVTDEDNNVIESGYSPLTIVAANASVRVHYAENESCDGLEMCNIARIKATLPCPFPTDVIISGVTTSAATFSWTAGGEETQWEVLLVEASADGPSDETAGIAVNGTPTYAVSDLLSAAPYKFYIRANCGSEFSPWVGPYNFSGGCDPITTVNEGFESTEPPVLPTCWTGLLVNAAEYASIETVWNGHTGNYAVQIANDESSSSALLMLVSPKMSTVATGTHRVKFFARSFGSATLEVGTSSSATSDAVFTPIQTITVGDTYAEYTVDFSDYEGEDTFFAFRHPSPFTYNPIFIDDIRWELSPLCADVQGIAITSASTNSATLSWAGNGEPGWDIVFGTVDVDDPTTLTPVSPAPTGEPVGTISGLLPDTDYKVWVRSSCGGTDGVGAWIGPVSFRTPCLPIATFNENFNSTDFWGLPSCWTSIIAGETVSNSAFAFVTGDGLNGSRSAELSNFESEATDEIILVSPNLSTLTTADHRLKFYGRSGGSVEIGTLSSPIGGGNFTNFQTIQLTTNWAEYVVDFSDYQGTDTYIGIRHAGGPYTRILLDNLRWELTPACEDVVDISVSDITSDSATLTWNPTGGETAWDVVLGGENDTDPSVLTPFIPSITGMTELALSDLTDNTVYNVWVRSACGGTDGNGAWIGPVTFRTACIAVDTLSESFETAEPDQLSDCWTPLVYGPTIPEFAGVRIVPYDAFTGEHSVELWPSDAGAEDYVMLVSPALNTVSTATHRLKLRAFTYGNATLVIGTMNGNSSSSEFTAYQQVTVSMNYNEYVINFDGYSGTDTYFALRNITPNTSIFVDDILWEPLPPCPDVMGIVLSDPTTDGTSVSWIEEGGESFQLAYGASDVTDPDTLPVVSVQTDTNYTITGLAPGEDYRVWVRSSCGPEGNGVWRGPYQFTTLCLPVSVPYLQDFESVDTPELPACTVLQNVGLGNNWETEYFPGFGFETTTLVYNWAEGSANTWFYTIGLNLNAGTEYTLSYRYGNNSSDNYVEKLKVAYGSSPVASEMINELADHPEINTAVASTNEVTFTPDATGVYYFGFNAYSDGDQYQLYLDDISIDSVLSIPGVDDSRFSFYPNPVKDVVYLSHGTTIQRVDVLNLLGQVVSTRMTSDKNVTLDISDLSVGTYLLRVTTESGSQTAKLIKK